jgi:hypothetical protein
MSQSLYREVSSSNNSSSLGHYKLYDVYSHADAKGFLLQSHPTIMIQQLMLFNAWPDLSAVQLHPPTAVSHCAEAFFTHAASKQQGAVAPNLVVARGTRLEVYSLK